MIATMSAIGSSALQRGDNRFHGTARAGARDQEDEHDAPPAAGRGRRAGPVMSTSSARDEHDGAQQELVQGVRALPRAVAAGPRSATASNPPP